MCLCVHEYLLHPPISATCPAVHFSPRLSAVLSAMDSTFGDRKTADEAIIDALRAAAASASSGGGGGATPLRYGRGYGGGDGGAGPLSQSSGVEAAAAAAAAWTSLCVQQCDLCLLVGQAHTAPELSLAEKEAVFRVNPSSATASAAGGERQHQQHHRQGSSPSLSTSSGGGGDGLLPSSRTFCRKELVLLHPDPSRRPAGTRCVRAWCFYSDV